MSGASDSPNVGRLDHGVADQVLSRPLRLGLDHAETDAPYVESPQRHEYMLLIVCRRTVVTLRSSGRACNPDDDVLAAFGAEVRRRREASGMSQEELAHRAGLHRTYTGSVERGERNVSLRNISAIAKALGSSPRDLL